MCRFVNRPHHQILAGILALFPEPEKSKRRKKSSRLSTRQLKRVPLSIVHCKRTKSDRECITIVPEILASDIGATSDMRSTTIGQACLGMIQEPRMPQSK